MNHVPVLLNEVLEILNPGPNQNFIDATVGNGGHARAILEKTAPGGKLIAIDRDRDSLDTARTNLREFGKRVVFIDDSFGNVIEIVKKSEVGHISGILFDFGMATSQLENSGRGFSFQKDEILDMRYDIKSPVMAEDIVNDYSESELKEIFEKWGEEPKAKIIAKAIVLERSKKRIKTTGQLISIIEEVSRRRGKIHPATLVFQALRIEVNKELEEIEKALSVIPGIIADGGKAVFISFHSLEDRLVKNWEKKMVQNGIVKILNKKPITASNREVKENPRSRSAKLRAAERI